MNKLLNKLENFWFGPAPAERLAILRIATGGFSMWYLLSRFDMMERIAGTDISMYDPVGLAQLFNAPLPVAVFSSLLWITVGLNLAYIFGWKFKYTGPAFAILLLLVLSYRNSWNMIYHNRIALLLHVFVIGFVAAADALSWDALNRAKKGLSKRAPHWRYGWPVKLICVGTVLTYFLSGAAKVFGDLAWSWMTGEAMRSQVAVDALRKEILGENTSPLFEVLYPYAGLFMIMGVVTMILEFGAPLFLLNRRASMVWAVLTWLMHWGIFFIMGIKFRYHQSGLLFLPFFEIEKGWFWLKRRFTDKTEIQETGGSGERREPALVLFDGVCNFCDGTVRFILDHDTQQHFKFASLQSDTGEKMLKRYHAPVDLSTIVLIENEKVDVKSSAVLRIARRLPGLWKLLFAFIILPKGIRDAAYNVFARYRYQWFGQKAACEIPSPEVQGRFLS